MLLLSESILNRPVMSLRTGGTIATSTSIIVNPDNLKIEGLFCSAKESKKDLVLLFQDIRNIVSKGIVVNDHEALSTPEILIRLKKILDINYQLLGKNVVTVSKSRVGKVKDFALEAETFYIQKLYVTKSLVTNLMGEQLSVDRSQIVEITDNNIVIQDLNNAARVGAPAASTVIPT